MVIHFPCHTYKCMRERDRERERGREREHVQAVNTIFGFRSQQIRLQVIPGIWILLQH